MSTNKSSVHREHRKVAAAAGVLGLATLISRILGFIRDMVIARLFGVYLYSQAFVIAFKIPNLFRDLLGEGAANAAVVPVMSEYALAGDRSKFWEVANIGMNLLLVLLSAVTVAGILLSPVLVRLIAPGFSADPVQFAVTVKLNRIIFPYILLAGLTAYGMGLLNTLKHFSVPAFGPCLLNISIIACALIWGEGVRGLASGVLVGGILQLAIQIPVLYRKGMRFSFTGRFRHPAIRRMARLMGPRLFSSALYQLNNFVDTIFGSLAIIVGQGGVAALYFAYRLIQFPLGIFGNSVSQAVLPTLSAQASAKDWEQMRSTVSFGIRTVLLVMVPATIAFMVLSRPIISSLFSGGRFDAYAVKATADALLFYSIGLSAYGVSKILQGAFFALQDTATPAKVSALGLVLNVGLNAILMYPLRLSGLALSTSISGCICSSVLAFSLLRRIGGLNIASLGAFLLRVFAASCGMGLVCFWSLFLLRSAGISGRILTLAVPVLMGVASFTVLSLLLRISEVKQLGRWLLPRRQNPGETP